MGFMHRAKELIIKMWMTGEWLHGGEKLLVMPINLHCLKANSMHWIKLTGVWFIPKWRLCICFVLYSSLPKTVFTLHKMWTTKYLSKTFSELWSTYDDRYQIQIWLSNEVTTLFLEEQTASSTYI